MIGLVLLWHWAHQLHRQPAKSRIRPYDISERTRIRALWFLGTATLIVGAAQWLPYARGYYDEQLFSLAVGSLSGFFVAWCVIAIGLRVKFRRR